MRRYESEKLRVRLQPTEMGDQIFLVVFPFVEYLSFPAIETRTEYELTIPAVGEAERSTPPIVSEQLYDVDVEPVSSSRPASDVGEMKGYEPTLIIEKPQQEALSLEAPEESNWKITVKKPESTLAVPRKKLPKFLFIVFILFAVFGLFYWARVEPIRGKTDSLLRRLALLLVSRTESVTPERPKEEREEKEEVQESMFKKELRRHLERILGE